MNMDGTCHSHVNGHHSDRIVARRWQKADGLNMTKRVKTAHLLPAGESDLDRQMRETLAAMAKAPLPSEVWDRLDGAISRWLNTATQAESDRELPVHGR